MKVSHPIKLAITSSLAWVLVSGAGCQTFPIEDDHPSSASTVEYVTRAPQRDKPVNPPAIAYSSYPSHSGTYIAPSRSNARVVVTERHGASTVRYEPIERPDAITSEELWGDNEDHDRMDSRDTPSAPARRSTSSKSGTSDVSDTDARTSVRPSDVPLEDRPNAKRPKQPTRTEPYDASKYAPRFTSDGIAFPYPTDKTFRGFGKCRGRRHHHEGIDLGGVGPQWGIGTPIRSMALAEILFIGTGETDPDQFGHPDKRSGEALRGDRLLPRSKDIEGYGTVHFFTRTKGRWRSGTIVVTRALEGPLAGHTIRYLHLAAVRPDLIVGAVLEPGDELGLMGGTGVQESAPHLHLDIAAPDGRRLDVAPILGLAPTASCKDDPPQMLAKDSRVEPTVSKNPPPTQRARATAAAKIAGQTAGQSDGRPAPEQLAARSPSRAHDPYAHIPRAATPTARRGADAKAAESRSTTSPTPGVHHAGTLQLTRCKSTTRTEDFASGRFAAHSVDLELERDASLTVEVLRKGGRWKPRVQVSGADDRTLASGKIGKKAVSTVKAKPGRLTVQVTGWDGAPPTDASYSLKITEKCRR